MSGHESAFSSTNDHEAESVVVRGQIQLPYAVTLPAEATICVRVVDATEADTPAPVIAEVCYPSGQFQWPSAAISFELAAHLDDPRRDYNVAAHVNRDGVGPPERGDFITAQSYPLRGAASLPGPIVIELVGLP